MMIATLGPCLPADLLEATGRHAGPLSWELNQPTPLAGQWLENKFPAWAHAVAEAWTRGAFDEREAVIFSRGDDAVQRLYYYVCELQRRGLIGGPRPVIFDVAHIPRATSEAHTIAAVRSLAHDLEVDEAALERGIAHTNQRRGAACEPPAGPGRVCLLLGTPPPHRLLHRAIEAAGFVPLGETLQETWAALGPPVEEGSGDPAAAIGRQVHARHNDRRDFGDRTGRVIEAVRRARPAAAVQWYSEEDEARIWDLPAVSQALRDSGVPVLVLTRRDELAGDGAAEEIRAFLEGNVK